MSSKQHSKMSPQVESTANTTWGDIFECCFKAQSSSLFSLNRGKRDLRALCFEAGVSSHAACIARSNAVPRIERVSCLLCLVCLCYRAQCVASGTAAAPATPAATLGTHAPVPLHLLQHSAGCMSQSFLRLRAFRWHVCACVQILPGLLTG